MYCFLLQGNNTNPQPYPIGSGLYHTYQTFHTKVVISHNSRHHPIVQAVLNGCSWHSLDYQNYLVVPCANSNSHFFRWKALPNALHYQCPYSQSNTELENIIKHFLIGII